MSARPSTGSPRAISGARYAGVPGVIPAAVARESSLTPVTDFTRISEGFGVPARRATTAEELTEALRWSQSEPGPHLIEAIVPPVA